MADKVESTEMKVTARVEGVDQATDAVKKLTKAGKAGSMAAKAEFLGYAGDLVEPIALLAGGASKTEAAWAGFRAFWLQRVIGPIGLLSGVAVGGLLALNKLSSAFRQVGRDGAMAFEVLQRKFTSSLGSDDLAGERVREVQKFAIKTPFEQDDVVQANLNLENLTRGALSTEDGMTLVGDAASYAGISMEQTGELVGRLYDSLQNGRPIGMVGRQMAMLGLMSGTARNALESAQEQGKKGSDVWRIAEKELGRFAGTMEETSRTLEALEGNLADAQGKMAIGFSSKFLEGEKASVEAMTNAVERMTPVTDHFATQFAMISNATAKGKAGISNFVTGLPGLQQGLILAGTLAQGVMTAIAATSGFAVLKSGVNVLKRVRSGDDGGDAKVIKRVDKAQGSMAKAGAAVASGSLKGAAAHSLNATRLIGLAAAGNLAGTALTVLSRGFRGAAQAARFMGRQFLSVMKLALANPFFKVGLALTLLASAVVGIATKFSRMAAAVKQVTDATRDQVSVLEAQRRAVQTVDDLQAAHIKTVGQLMRAEKKLGEVRRENDARVFTPANRQLEAALRDQIQALQAELAKLQEVDPARLERPQESVEDERKHKEAVKQAEREAERANRQRLPPEQRQMAIAAAMAEQEAENERGKAQAQADEKFQDEKNIDQQKINSIVAARGRLNSQIEEQEEKAPPSFLADPKFDRQLVTGVKRAASVETAKEVERLKKERAALIEEQLLLETGARAADASGNEVEQLRALISMQNTYNSSVDAMAQAEKTLADLRANPDSEQSAVEAELDKIARIKEELPVIRSLISAQGATVSLGSGLDSLAEEGVQVDDLRAEYEKVEEARKGAIAANDISALVAVFEQQKKLVEEMEKRGGGMPLGFELDARALQDAEVLIQAFQERTRKAQEEGPSLLEGLQQESTDLAAGQNSQLTSATLDKEEASAALQSRGTKLELEMLSIAKARVEQRREEGRISEAVANEEKEAIDRRKDLVNKLAKERQAEAMHVMKMQTLTAQARVAESTGDFELANQHRTAMAESQQDSRRRELEKESEMFAKKEDRASHVSRGMELFKAQARAGVVAKEDELASRTLQIESRRAFLAGDGKAGRELRESAARKQDELKRTRLKDQFQEVDKMSPDEARAAADKQIKLDQASRLLDEMGSGRGAVVADSLQRIGGGGRFAGVDPRERNAEIANTLLRQIANNTKQSIDADLGVE